MLGIILFRPEKPANLGNIMRTCVATDTKLFVIGPLSFELSDKELRRAGMDYINDLDYKYAICKSSNGELESIDIENLQIIDEPNQLSKDIQAQLILFEGQCKMNAMLACNMQRKVCNESMAYIDCDFIDLQEEIECRINELK